MKKIIVLMLSILLSISFQTVAFAQQETKDTNEAGGDICIFENFDGTFTKYGSKCNLAKLVVSPMEEFDGVYMSKDNKYFQKISDDTFTIVEKKEFNLIDYDANRQIQSYNFPEEVLKEINSMAAFAERQGYKDAKCVIFLGANGNKEGLNTSPMVTSYWDGMTFHTYQVNFTNMYTEWKTVAEKGETTQAALSAIKDLAAIAGGLASGQIGIAVNLYNGGQSCLSVWKSATGSTPIYGNTNNKVMADICYDTNIKFTYFYDKMLNLDRLGCRTQRVYVKKIETDTYLYSASGGKKVSKVVRPNKAYKSPNYDNPEEKAFYNYISPWVEIVKGKIYNKTILYSYPNFDWPSNWPNH